MTQQVRRLKPGCRQGWFPLVTSEEESARCFCPSIQCPVMLHLSWFVAASLQSLPPLSRGLIPGVCLPRRAAVIRLRAHPDPVFFHLNLLTSAKTPFLPSSSSSFFFFFFCHCVACGILVARPGIEPMPPGGCRVLHTGPPGKRAPPISKLTHIHG